jgi:PAS domain S-box-containing protein
MFPFSTKTIKGIAMKGMEDRADELIHSISSAPTKEDLILYLKNQKPLIFFRVSIIDNERHVLYDTHTKRLFASKFDQNYVVSHPETLEAMARGKGYHEEYSGLLKQKFAYFAKAFDFHGKTYVLRTAFPYKYVAEVTHDFEMGFLIWSGVMLLLFSLMTWFVIHRLTSPIDQIITAIKPYQEGKQTVIPEIRLSAMNPEDDFGRLASTLNSLSQKIQMQIDSLTQERNQKEAILESLIEGVVAVDKEMHITYANNMAEKLLGFSREGTTLQDFSIINRPELRSLLQNCLKQWQPLTFSLQMKKNGGKAFYDIVSVPTKDHNQAVLVIQDKTSEYKMLEMRKDFIANASHELKTPITIIRGFAESLHDHPDLPKETMIEITDKIVKNCQRMTTLIKDLLALADIENLPHSRLTECDLLEIAHNCRSMVLDVFPSAEITIETSPEDADMHLMADPDLMELAVMNLIENAAKYSNPPAHIKVTFTKQNHDYIQFSVSDKGIGIPPNDLENIFQRFYTVNKAHSQKMGGSGLGLSIVENIIAKHFGKISVESTLGVGTTFTIILPTQMEKMI